MAWRGVSDQNIFFSRFDGSNWLPQSTVPGVGTSAMPALAVLNDRLVMVWKGIESAPAAEYRSVLATWS